MDIKQITYFMTIVQEGSFSRASERLAVSQPALSIAVKKLEEELGVELFYSFDRKQHLTAEGQCLMEGAKKLLDVYRKTVEDVKVTSQNSSGSFNFGLAPLFGSCFFGELIPSCTKAYPNIKVNMIEEGANKIDRKLESGEVDIAVTLATEHLSSFSSCHFSTQRNVALVHRSHPLAQAESITVADLRDDHFAIFSPDFILYHQIMDACRTAGFKPKIALLSTQWDFMAEIVARNQGVSILPKPIMDKHPDPNIRCIPLTDSMRYWDIVLAWNNQKYMPKPCRMFLDYICNNLPPDDLG